MFNSTNIVIVLFPPIPPRYGYADHMTRHAPLVIQILFPQYENNIFARNDIRVIHDSLISKGRNFKTDTDNVWVCKVKLKSALAIWSK